MDLAELAELMAETKAAFDAAYKEAGEGSDLFKLDWRQMTRQESLASAYDRWRGYVGNTLTFAEYVKRDYRTYCALCKATGQTAQTFDEWKGRMS